MHRMIRGLIGMIAASISLLATPAQAELTLCNRTSYRMEAAIGLEKRANVATRGWFRLDPGQCRQVLDGPLDADMVYVHARTPPVYGTAPLPQNGQAEFCIRNGDFDIANARGCPVSQQARFTAAQAVGFAERAGRQSGGRCRLRRRAGAACRHPAAARHRRLRRLSDRRRAGRQDAGRARQIPQRPQARRRRRVSGRNFSTRCSMPRTIRKASAFPGATTPNTR